MRFPVLAVLFPMLLAACSHSPARAPSSLPSASLTATLDDILASPDPRARAHAYVDRLLRIEVRAHGWMYETDRVFQHAKGPVDLFDQPSYRRLLLAKPLTERMQDKIAQLYGEALALSRADEGAGDPAPRAQAAREVIKGVHDALLHARHDAAERVLLNDLMRALREVRHASGKPAGPHPFLTPLEGEELHSAAAAAGSAIEQLVEALPESDEVKEEIDAGEEELARELAPAAGREPQSAGIYPSPGPNGNIDGFTFPRGTWAVTFDDGPHESITEEDLANLKAAGNKATFFWLAKNLVLYPNIVKTVMAAGMPVENHSWTHAQLDKPSDLARLHTNLDREINQSTAQDVKSYGVKPRFFRCPYGAGFRNPVIRGMIARLGMVHVRWNVDSLDWKDNNPATVQARVEQQMRANGRGIILFHDIHTAALTAVPRLFAKYKGQLRWVTIPQIVDELNGNNGAPRRAEPPAQ